MTQYINKDALAAEIEKLKHRIDVRYSYSSGWKDALLMVEAKLDTLEVKEVDLENRTKILADIIFDAAKHGYMPYDTQDEHCAMEKARRNIIKLI